MANISYTKVGDTTFPMSLPYTTCGTAAGTAAKTADLANFSLDAGTSVHVKFTYANTAANPTLNINSTGAKAIKAYGTTAPTVYWKAGAVVEFVYDGTNYVMTNVGAIPDGSVTTSGGGLSKGSAGGGGLSGGGLTSTVTSLSATAYNASIGSVTTTQPSSGPYIKLDASAEAKRNAVTSSNVTQTVTRAAVKDTRTGGYIATRAETTVINSDSVTVSLNAGSLGSATISSATLTKYYPITQGTAQVTSSTYSSVPLTLDGTSYTASVDVTPDVTAGWIDSGLPGTVTLKGTVPTETKSATGAGDVTPSSGKLLSKVTVGSGNVTASDTALNCTPAAKTTTVASSTPDIVISAGTTTQPTAAGVMYITATGGSQAKTGESCTVTKTAGWITAGTIGIGSSASATTDTRYYPFTIAQGSVTLSDTALNCTPNAKTTSATASNTNITLGSRTTTAPSSGLYLTVTGGSDAKNGESCTVTKKAGWIAAGTVGVSSSASATTNTGYYPVTIKAGSAAVTSATYQSVALTLDGTSYTASVDVTPAVTAGWVESGLPGTVTLKGTVPTQTKAASGSGTVSPDSGKLLSSVTVAAGTVTSSDNALSVSPVAKNTTVTSSSDSITIGSGTTTVPTGLYIKTVGGSYEATGESSTITKKAGWIAAGTFAITSSATQTTDERYFPITIKSGSVSSSDNALNCTPNAKTTTASASNSNITLGSRTTTAPSSGLYLTVTGGSDAKTGESSTITKTAGWISGGTFAITSSASATTSTGYYPVTIKSGGVTASDTALNCTPAVKTTTASASNSNITLGSRTTTAPASGLYLTVTGGSSAKTGESCTVTKTEGWISGGTIGISSSASETTSTGYYPVTIKSGSVTASDTALNCTPAVKTTTGTLSSSSKISLGSRTTTAPSSGLYLTVTGGSSAKTGESCTVTKGEGWIAGGTIGISSSASETTSTGYYPVTIPNGYLSVPNQTKASDETTLNGTTLTVKATPTGGTVTIPGWVENADDAFVMGAITITGTVPTQTKAASGSGTVSPDSGKLLSSVTVAAGTVTSSDNALAVSPVAKNTTVTSSGDSITIGSGTTTVPTGLYIKTVGGSYEATGESSTITRKAGWITAGTFAITSSATQTTDERYFPITIKSGSVSAATTSMSIACNPTAKNTTATASNTNITLGSRTTTAPASGLYLTVEGGSNSATNSASSLITKSAGWIAAGTFNVSASVSANATTSTAYYPVTIKSGSVSASDTALNCTPNAKTTTASASNTNITLGSRTTTAPTSGLYLTVTGGSAAKTGESCTVTKTAGWIAGGTIGISSSASETTNTGYYPVTIKSGDVTASTTSIPLSCTSTAKNSTATASNTNITLGTRTTTQPSSGLYITVTGGSTGGTNSGSSLITKSAGWIAAGTFSVSANASTNDTTSTAYYPVTIKAGSASVADATKASTSTSLSGTVLTVQASVSPSVTEGWVSSGTAGTIKITGTVPTQTKAASGAGTISPDSGKLLSSVTVAEGSVSASTTSIPISCTSTAKDSTATASNANITLGTRTTTQPSSGLYLTVTGGSTGGTNSGSALITKGAGWIAAGTFNITGSASTNDTTNTAYYPVTIKAGSASVAGATLASTSTSLSGTTLTVQASVSPTVTEGWVSSGTAGTIKITGTVPTQMKTATASGVITPDSGKLLSGVTVSIPDGSATVAAATVSVTLQNSTGSIGNPTTAPSTASQTNNIVLGTVTSTKPSSGLYLQVSGGVSKQTKSGVATLTKTAGYIAAGTASVSTNIQVGTNTRYYPITLKAGSAVVGATTVTPGVLTGTWNASTSKYVVSQASKTVSISGSVTTGWVSTIGSGTITLSPTSYEISGGVITNNTSGGSSAGTINSGSQIKIGAGYYPNDLYYTAASGGGSWDWSGNLTIDGNPGAPNEQSLYIYTGDSDSYSAVFTSTGGGYGAKSGYCTGYMNYSAGNNSQLCDYYQFDACTSSSPLKVIYMSSSNSWAFMIGSYWYNPGTGYTTDTYYKQITFSGAPRVYYIELWPETGIGSIMMRYRAL